MHMNMNTMAAKNVALRAEVVHILDREKRDGESYSDVIFRLVTKRPSLGEMLEKLRQLPVEDSPDLDRRLKEIRRHGNRGRPLAR